jgi:hypothetical protein
MTHDELLAKVSNYKNAGLGSLVALRAIVELHKPDYEMCMTCKMTHYPCPTIQAIHKELN